MRYGHFDDERREYVIDRPDTPLPWINYLGTEAYFGIVSNTAGGYSFYRDARLRRLTRYRYNNAPFDLGGRYLYVRDDATGDFWSPSWQPTRSALDEYECRHGLSYTQFAYSDIKVIESADATGVATRTVEMTIKNTGERAGAEIVQLYVRADKPAVMRPEKELKAFRKVFLKPEETQTVSLPLPFTTAGATRARWSCTPARPGMPRATEAMSTMTN